MWLLWALLLLGVLVLVHELGHFLVAKATGVKVLRFSIGFGPKLIGLKLGETEYRISAVPLGGYVKMLAQESSEPIPAGVTALDPNGAAYAAGLRRGDRILAVMDNACESWREVGDEIALHPDDDIVFDIERDGKEMRIVIAHTEPAEPVLLPPAPDGVQHGITFPNLGLTVSHHPDELSRAFFQKPIWARFLVVLAGPMASMLFPVLIYFVYFIGIDQMTSTRIGQVVAGSPAAEAGLLPGDRVLAVNGEDTRFWSDMSEMLRERPGEQVTLTIERENNTKTLTITPASSEVVDQIGQKVTMGRIGVLATTIPAIVGPVGENSPAYAAGLRMGDTITAVNGEKIEYIWQLEPMLEELKLSGRAVQLDVTRPAGENSAKPETFSTRLVPREAPNGGYVHGIASADTLVGKVEPGSPAEKAGLQVGDQVLSIDGRPVSSWVVVEQVLREKLDQPISFTIERDGERRTITMSQKKEVVKDQYQAEVTRYSFGAWPAVANDQWLDGERLPVENRLAFAIAGSVETLIDITILELRIFGMLFSGQLPFKMVGGPIMIFDVAGKAAESGWQQYLWIMAMISINLGILNLLPVPVLDGGHLMFYTIEAIVRRPLNQRIKERAITVGFFMLMLLMVLVFKNDIERYWDVIFG